MVIRLKLKVIMIIRRHFLLAQTFNGPRCDLYKNILAHGCSAASLIMVSSSEETEEVRLYCLVLNRKEIIKFLLSSLFLLLLLRGRKST